MTADAARQSPCSRLTLPGDRGKPGDAMRVLPSRTTESGESK
ncbi:hypothetical protein FB465_5186 [Kitasatospora atroaurantiaca]|uniref:Uncharacterized protein n=1 Tax=Kitasatospora atroaurantiaca TaxID=285545 RepID=A0A561EWP9_9ACTN|nr:hypothetical protein FB465_5186 [Kitasatospora atroaurantiaca]